MLVALDLKSEWNLTSNWEMFQSIQTDLKGFTVFDYILQYIEIASHIVVFLRFRPHDRYRPLAGVDPALLQRLPSADSKDLFRWDGQRKEFEKNNQTSLSGQPSKPPRLCYRDAWGMHTHTHTNGKLTWTYLSFLISPWTVQILGRGGRYRDCMVLTYDKQSDWENSWS